MNKFNILIIQPLTCAQVIDVNDKPLLKPPSLFGSASCKTHTRFSQDAKVYSRCHPPLFQVFSASIQRKKGGGGNRETTCSAAKRDKSRELKGNLRVSHLSSSSWSRCTSQARCDARDAPVCEHSGITATSKARQLFPSGKLKLNQDRNHLSGGQCAATFISALRSFKEVLTSCRSVTEDINCIWRPSPAVCSLLTTYFAYFKPTNKKQLLFLKLSLCQAAKVRLHTCGLPHKIQIYSSLIYQIAQHWEIIIKLGLTRKVPKHMRLKEASSTTMIIKLYWSTVHVIILFSLTGK